MVDNNSDILGSAVCHQCLYIGGVNYKWRKMFYDKINTETLCKDVIYGKYILKKGCKIKNKNDDTLYIFVEALI